MILTDAELLLARKLSMAVQRFHPGDGQLAGGIVDFLVAAAPWFVGSLALSSIVGWSTGLNIVPGLVVAGISDTASGAK